MITKLISLLIPLLLLSCKQVEVKDVVDFIDLQSYVESTDSVIPIDTASYNSVAVETKAKAYIAKSYAHSTSTHYDSYGLLLPTKDGDFDDKGDASGWNSIALSSMCLINRAYTEGKLIDSSFNLQADITQLWTDFKSSVITSDGTLIRHPEDTDGTSVSKDMITMFLNMLAVAHYTNCEPIKTDAVDVLTKFITYGKSHSWDYGLSGRTAPSTTLLVGRHSLYDVQKLYNLGYSDDYFNLSTSLEGTKTNATIADYLNYNKTKCRQGYAGSCLRIANAGVYGNHLTFQTVVTHRIAGNVYGTSDTTSFFEDLAKVGQNLGYSNWLFVAGYRHFVLGSSATYNDIGKHLETYWPDSLPTSSLGVTDWGCTVFIWQRTVGEKCNNSTVERVGNDFLLLFGYSL